MWHHSCNRRGSVDRILCKICRSRQSHIRWRHELVDVGKDNGAKEVNLRVLDTQLLGLFAEACNLVRVSGFEPFKGSFRSLDLAEKTRFASVYGGCSEISVESEVGFVLASGKVLGEKLAVGEVLRWVFGVPLLGAGDPASSQSR
ncbi:hypothetical protein LZ32DRAFT_306583 [Colletotrichum eremochloae]|nr:hypothetical protein LZ32DRAFT_306583 [Colletotrichum eremochloae]